MNTWKRYVPISFAIVFAVISSVGVYHFLKDRAGVSVAATQQMTMIPVVVAKNPIGIGNQKVNPLKSKVMARAGPAATLKDIRIKVILPSKTPKEPGTKETKLINLTKEKTIKYDKSLNKALFSLFVYHIKIKQQLQIIKLYIILQKITLERSINRKYSMKKKNHILKKEK